MAILKEIFYFLRQYLAIPALTIHELSHIIVLRLFFVEIDDVTVSYIDKKRKLYRCDVTHMHTKSKIVEILQSLAPAFTVLILVFVSMFNIIFSLIYIPYTLMFFWTSMPSKFDLENIENYVDYEALMLDVFSNIEYYDKQKEKEDNENATREVIFKK